MKRTFGTMIIVVMVLLTLSVSVAAPSVHAAASASQAKQHVGVQSSISITPCDLHGYLAISSPLNGVTCFRDTGYIGFRIDDATFLHAGNNNGWIQCYGGDCASAGQRLPFQAFQEFFLGGTLITQVDITGQG